MARGCLEALLAIGAGIALALWVIRGAPAAPALPTSSSTIRTGEGELAAFPPAVRRWEPQIRRAAAACGLDPALVAALATAESCGDPQAVSKKGARGLLQVMPFHFAPGEDPLDPEANLRVGVGILCRLLREADGDLPRALAAYNGGPRLLRLPPAAWPAESQLLAARVLRHLEDARAGRPIRCP